MKNMKYLMGCTLLLSAPAVWAEEEEGGGGLALIPSIAYQHKQLSFDQKYTDSLLKPINENGRKSDFDIYLPTVNASLTAAMGGFYLTLKMEDTIAEGHVSVDETRPASRSAISDPYYLNVPGHNTEVERRDRSVTLGYNIWSGLNVFAGYMWGETHLRPEATCFTFPVPCSALNLAADLENEGREDYRQEYTEEGPYMGLSYGWLIADAGTLSVSAAYAKMDGQFKDNYVTTAFGDEHFNFEGDSTGTSIGVTWSAPLGEASAYFLDIRQQKYSMDGKDTDTPSTYLDTVEVETDETMLGVTAGLQFYF